MSIYHRVVGHAPLISFRHLDTTNKTMYVTNVDKICDDVIIIVVTKVIYICDNN